MDDKPATSAGGKLRFASGCDPRIISFPFFVVIGLGYGLVLKGPAGLTTNISDMHGRLSVSLTKIYGDVTPSLSLAQSGT